jgi:hypothetical protein
LSGLPFGALPVLLAESIVYSLSVSGSKDIRVEQQLYTTALGLGYCGGWPGRSLKGGRSARPVPGEPARRPVPCPEPGCKQRKCPVYDTDVRRGGTWTSSSTRRICPDAMKERGLAPRDSRPPRNAWGCFTSATTKEAPVDEYDGKQYVGMDLHRRRSVIVRTTREGERIGSPCASTVNRSS